MADVGIVVLIGTVSSAFLIFCLTRGQKMRDDKRPLTIELLWYAGGLVPLAGTCLLWASLGDHMIVAQRIFTGIVGAAIGAAILLWLGEFLRSGKPATLPQTVQAAPPAPMLGNMPAPIRTATVPEAGLKIFSEKTPKQILSYFETLSPLEAAQLVHPYRGLWMTFETVVEKVLPDTHPNTAYGYFKDSDGATLDCRFGPSQYPRMMRVKTGDKLKITGRINHIQQELIGLLNCEVLDN